NGASSFAPKRKDGRYPGTRAESTSCSTRVERTYTMSCISVWHGVRRQECVGDSALMPEERRKANGRISRSLRCGTTLGKKRSRNWKAYCDMSIEAMPEPIP